MQEGSTLGILPVAKSTRERLLLPSSGGSGSLHTVFGIEPARVQARNAEGQCKEAKYLT
jgi:hypothetical protein